jgi:hypothetical protein
MGKIALQDGAGCENLEIAGRILASLERTTGA